MRPTSRSLPTLVLPADCGFVLPVFAILYHIYQLCHLLSSTASSSSIPHTVLSVQSGMNARCCDMKVRNRPKAASTWRKAISGRSASSELLLSRYKTHHRCLHACESSELNCTAACDTNLLNWMWGVQRPIFGGKVASRTLTHFGRRMRAPATAGRYRSVSAGKTSLTTHHTNTCLFVPCVLSLSALTFIFPTPASHTSASHAY